MSNPSLAELGAQCFPIYRRFEMSRGEVCCGSDMVSATPSTDLSLAIALFKASNFFAS